MGGGFEVHFERRSLGWMTGIGELTMTWMCIWAVVRAVHQMLCESAEIEENSGLKMLQHWMHSLFVPSNTLGMPKIKGGRWAHQVIQRAEVTSDFFHSVQERGWTLGLLRQVPEVQQRKSKHKTCWYKADSVIKWERCRALEISGGAGEKSSLIGFNKMIR